MKKLSKLTINPSKVMKNEELVNLKGGYTGGYGRHYLKCNRPSGSCSTWVETCDDVEALTKLCDDNCFEWNNYICV
jgi:hypothetical protein